MISSISKINRTLEDGRDRKHIYDELREAAKGLSIDITDRVLLSGIAGDAEEAVWRVRELHGEGVEGGFTFREISVIQALAFCKTAEIEAVDQPWAGGEYRYD